MTIDNDDQLRAVLLHDLSQIVNDVAQEIFLLLKEKIKEAVYDSNDPHTYERRGEDGGLLGSWVVNSTSNIGRGKIKATIEQDPFLLELNREDFVHGSAYSDYYSDIRDTLSEIIIEGKSGSLFGDGFWREKRDFWTPLINQLDGGAFDRIVAEAFAKRGISFISK